jgi:hypothetical protein
LNNSGKQISIHWIITANIIAQRLQLLASRVAGLKVKKVGVGLRVSAAKNIYNRIHSTPK